MLQIKYYKGCNKEDNIKNEACFGLFSFFYSPIDYMGKINRLSCH